MEQPAFYSRFISPASFKLELYIWLVRDRVLILFIGSTSDWGECV